MTPDLLLALDEGTTSARAIAFDLTGREMASHAVRIAQANPAPGWVEQDANELWSATRTAARAVLDEVGVARIAAIGLTNQRETIVFWDAATGAPLAPAIVWQDRRGSELCAGIVAAGDEPWVQARTGLVVDAYFSASKIAWALAHWPAVRAAADTGRLRLGTVDSWLLWKLTDGRAYATDATNASRTLLMDLDICQWDADLCARFGVPPDALPRIVDSAGRLGTATALGGLPITGCAGDQQAALIGHGCLLPGQAEATYGTGAFLLAHAGDTPPVSRHRLLATVAARIGGHATYALEGAVFVAGDAVRWMRDMGWFAAHADLGALAASVPDSGGAVFVPALTGLGAPWWRADARGALTGLTTATRPAHVARACLDSVAQQTADLLDAFAADGLPVRELRIGGGMAAVDWLAQRLADVCALPVERPRGVESTALGAAMLAGVGAGVFADLGAAAGAMRVAERRFDAAPPGAGRTIERAAWQAAIARVLA